MASEERLDMNIKLVFCAAALASFGLIACGDDTTGTGGGGQGGGGTGGSSTTTTTTTTSGGGNGGEGGAVAQKTCAEACAEVFDCGSADSFMLCPGWETGGTDGAPLTEAQFLNGSNSDGCIAGCEAQPALIAIVNPANCAGTVGTISNLNPAFKASCEGGEGGAGGGI
jgi:hypothetical protein